MELNEVLEARKHFNALVKLYKKYGYTMQELNKTTFEDFWNKLTQEIEQNKK